jgi:methyl-accepting chemotaxis protein
MAQTIGKKLGINTILFSLAAIVPFSVISIMAVSTARDSFVHDKFEQLTSIRGIKKAQIEKFFAERRGDMGVLVETVSTLRKEAFEKLTAVREVKRQAVERYFQTINDQVITFSEDRMVVDAMRQFRNSFHNYRDENNWTSDNIESMRRKLRTYYSQEFSTEYRNRNDSRSPDTERWFTRLDDDTIALQYQYIRANPHPLGSKHLLDHPGDASRYSQLHARYHPIIRSYLEKFGYYDIFLVDADSGDIVYSVFKELDYSTSLIDGPYARTNFGEAFRKANSASSKDAVILVDYARYAPSYEAPASFIASPIYDGKKKIGVAMFQMPIDRLNAIMTERAGLGKTGETYLVGADRLMRSNAFLDPKHHSVEASFKHPEKGKVETVAAKAALGGKTGAQVINDYNGNPVLSAYTPVNVGGLIWGLLAEIDVAEAFSPVDESGEAFFAKYRRMYGYYDLFLINPDGYIFYTVAKEADYQTNIIDGTYSGSNLGRLVRRVVDTAHFGIADFSPYAPSNDEPAAFIAQPVVHNGKVEVVVALQLSLEAINSIMQQREGMGKTGETYIVGQDKLMRSDSFLDPVHHSVKASFANPAAGSVDTRAAVEALSGKNGTGIIIDYNGNPVLSAYAPIKIDDFTWAMMVEIDEKEVVSESVAAEMLLNRIWRIAIIAMIVVAAVILMGVYIIRNLSKTLGRISDSLNEGSDQVASASGQVSSASQSLAEGASEQAGSIEETSASLEQMSSMTKQNAENARQADALMKETHQVVARAKEAMNDLAESMQEIAKASEDTSKIMKTIDEIAFQTNLLALNAAVEAARAGEAGAGFAVVSDEVRNLALRAADAAKNTAGLIEQTVKTVDSGSEYVTRTSEAFGNVAESVNKAGSLMVEIAAASMEQAQGIGQVNTAMAEMDSVTQKNAASSEESAAAAEEMNAQAEQMKAIVGELAAIVGNGHQKFGAGAQVDQTIRKAHRPDKPCSKDAPEIPPIQIMPEQAIPLDDRDFKVL